MKKFLLCYTQSMISAVTTNNIQKKSNARYKNIKYSGYIALGSIGVCGLTGIKQVKFPHKMKLHKISALVTAVSSLWHLGAIKRWDKILVNNRMQSNSLKFNKDA